MKARFKYDDIVRVQPGVIIKSRPGERAWIVGIFENRPQGEYFESFPPGVVYSIEFEDGYSTEIHESDLELEVGN